MGRTIRFRGKIAPDEGITDALQGTETNEIKDGAVTTVKIASSAVTTAKLATDAVETAKIKDANVTTAKIADSAVTQAKLAAGAGLAALFTSGIAANEGYDKTADETDTPVLAANGASEGDRVALVIVHVDETFADGDDGAQPTFALAVGGGGPFMANTVLADAVAGTVLVFAVAVPEEDAVEITAVPATPATNQLEAGAITVTVLALPQEVVPE